MTVRSAIGRRGPAVLAMAAGAIVMIVGSLLTWVRTGGARRNSYDLLSLVERLGFAPDGPAEPALRWWPLMPLLAAIGVVTAWWGWPRAGGAVGLVAACYGGSVAFAVGRSGSDLVDVAVGPAVTFVGALILGAGAVAAIVLGWLPLSSTYPER
jgi:hypothetical protein